MDVTPGLRRVAPPDLAEVGEDAALVARIRSEIADRGPMPFARFMDLALYDPEGGYYRGAEARPGRRGDFLTAPEAHPIFGWSLAVQLAELWHILDRPSRFVVREHGAGTGVLARATLDGLRRAGSGLLEAIVWQPVEIETRRLATFGRTLTEASFGARFELEPSGPVVGVVFANEVLDALPVHRLVMRSGRLVEVLVGLASDGRFEDVEGEPTSDALARRLAEEEVELADGQRAEVCLAIDGWLTSAAADLERGIVLVIDYGYIAAELYDSIRRRDGTLRAYVRHTVHDDPYRHIGRQDLTAHVDVTAVQRAAHAGGLESLGATTQAEFMAALGAGELLRSMQDDPATTLADYLEARASLGRMLDPAAMGRFRVIAFGRGLPGGALLRGLQPVLPGGR